jgi:hypothetical protein
MPSPTDKPGSANSKASGQPKADNQAANKPPAAKAQSQKPPAAQTSAAKPPATQTSAAKPPAAQTSAAKPPAAQTSAAKPPAAQTSPAKPPTAQTSAAKPPAAQTSAAKPPATQTSAAQTSAAGALTNRNFSTIQEWRQFVMDHWLALYQYVQTLQLRSEYEQIIAIMLTPVLPSNQKSLDALVKLISSQRYGKPISNRIRNIYASKAFNQPIKAVIQSHLTNHEQNLSEEDQEGLDWLIVTVGALAGATRHKKDFKLLAQKVASQIPEQSSSSSGVRVQADMINAGQNVIFAGHDVHIISHYYKGDKALLLNYLSRIRSDWNTLDFGSIIPGHNKQPLSVVRLHQLYTLVDIWKGISYEDKDLDQLTLLRFRAIDHDLADSRQPVLEAIASRRLIVITGGPGTGKSALCHFIATCLAYACDPDAEKIDKVNGLEMLGPAWIHGALLPLYVNLHNFCSTSDNCPATPEQGNAQHLLDYLRKTTDSFSTELERFLTNDQVPTDGTLLILDGLDEVYQESDRLTLQRIIESWADRFPRCRIMITSRTYAYRHDARWRLSDRFASAELAPYTWKQMTYYIENWYEKAALLRPASLGGREIAKVKAASMAKELMAKITRTPSLWALARQPLMLTLLTLIHEDNKMLPDKKAELYEQTVELLDRWNRPLIDDPAYSKLAGINLDRMRAAVKLTAFDLQSKQSATQIYPASIERKDLLEKLMQQQDLGGGLGAKIEDVLEYLGTRNGILVSDRLNLYRFPHLSVQEYLAACALIELYDECPMPESLTPENNEGWDFPNNMAQLLKYDPFRWRNVTLFAGSIIASGKGQDHRWDLIDELLPEEIKIPMDENVIHCINIAAEIWAETWLKARTRGQKMIEEHLVKCLKAIRTDDRLDVPERSSISKILQQLSKEHN